MRNIYKFLFGFLFFLLLTSSSYAADTYYVRSDGSDTRCTGLADAADPGSGGAGQACSWKTLSKVNGSSFSPDDSVLLKRGDTWHEYLTIPSSGSSGHPITFGAYGSGAKPKVLGSSELKTASWTQYTGVSTGSVSRDNMKLSLVNGTAFVDFSSPNTLTDNIGKQITITDSAGKHLVGYIKAAGAGETYGSELLSNTAFEDTTGINAFQTSVSSVAGGQTDNALQITIDSGKPEGNASQDFTTSNGALLKSSGYIKVDTAYSIRIENYLNGGDGHLLRGSESSVITDWGQKTFYSTADSSTLVQKYQVNNAENEIGLVDTASTTQVLTPSTNGVTITSTAGGSTFNWTSEEAGFNRNDSSGYTYSIGTAVSNVYQTSITVADIGNLIFNSEASVGVKKLNLGDLSAQGQFYYDSVAHVLYLYSTSDPSTFYASIEAAQYFSSQNLIQITGKNYVTIQDLDLRYAGNHGIMLDGTGASDNSDNIIIQRNDFSYIGGAYLSSARSGNGIEIYDQASNVTIKLNTFYNIYNRAVSINGADADRTISNININYNIIRNCENGFALYQTNGTNTSIDNVKFVNNDIYNSGAGWGASQRPDPLGYGVLFWTSAAAASNIYIENNIFHTGSLGHVYVFDTWNNFDNITWDYNTYYPDGNSAYYYNGSTYNLAGWALAKSKDSHSVSSDPLFASTSTPDFHLLRTSPAINSGTSVSLNSDFAGTTVPNGSAPDMGAYEYIPLTVTINQAVGQSDPTNSSPINFTVVFSESVSDFITGDVTLSGSAGATTGTVSGSGTTYNVAVSGMTGSGNVVASILADKATGATGNKNDVYTSSDNTVSYDVNPPILTSISITGISGYTNSATPEITIVSSNSPSNVAFSCNDGTNWSNWIAYADTISSFNITNGATGCTSSDGSKTITAKLKDSVGNESSTKSSSINYDANPPTISDVTSTSINDISATITWNTTEDSTSKLELGLTTGYGATTNDPTLSSSHSVSVNNLSPCVAYHYRVSSTDAATNERVGGDNTFNTTGCTGSAAVLTHTESDLIDKTIGGSVDLLSGALGIGLTIPDGFSSSDAYFQIKQLDQTSVINVTSGASGYQTIGQYLYDLRALTDSATQISTFDKPLTVNMYYDSPDVSGIDESTLRIFRWDGFGWNQLSDCTIDTTLKLVSCTTDGFSVFSLYGQSSDPKPPSNNTSSTPVSNGPPAPLSCSYGSPSGTPDLFEIDTVNNKATLYFSPAGMPYSSYYIAYGRVDGNWEYGVEFAHPYSPGVIKYTISSLNSNTVYFFKVRAGNSCATGNFSKSVGAKTTNSAKVIKKFYKNPIVALKSTVSTSVSSIVKSITTKKAAPKVISPIPVNSPEVKGLTTVNKNALPTVKPDVRMIPKVVQPSPTPSPKKNFCILWWCL